MYKLFKTGIEKNMLDTMNTIFSYRYHYKVEYEKYTCDNKSFEKIKKVIIQMRKEGSNDSIIHISIVRGKKSLPEIINIIKNKFNEFKTKFRSKT